VAVVSALGGRAVFDHVKPFGFQDPNSESARAYEKLKDATGERPIPEVELLVEPASGSPRAAARRVAVRLRTVAGIKQVITPAADQRLISDDHRAAVVLGFLSADVSDIADVGSRVRSQFADQPGVKVGGAAVTV